MKGSIDVVGLGAGRMGLMTLETWEKIRTAKHLYLRTKEHPTVAELVARGVSFASYDDFYMEAKNFAELYERIAGDLVRKAEDGEDVVYAVPGSPMVAEKTVVRLREICAEKEIGLKIYAGMSFLEILWTAVGIDPIAGVMVVDAEDVGTLPEGYEGALIVTQIYDQRTASVAKLGLMERYGDAYRVEYLRHLGLEEEERREIALYEVDRQRDVDALTCLYVPKKLCAGGGDVVE